jgi:hypothetical protein
MTRYTKLIRISEQTGHREPLHGPWKLKTGVSKPCDFEPPRKPLNCRKQINGLASVFEDRFRHSTEGAEQLTLNLIRWGAQLRTVAPHLTHAPVRTQKHRVTESTAYPLA